MKIMNWNCMLCGILGRDENVNIKVPYGFCLSFLSLPLLFGSFLRCQPYFLSDCWAFFGMRYLLLRLLVFFCGWGEKCRYFQICRYQPYIFCLNTPFRSICIQHTKSNSVFMNLEQKRSIILITIQISNLINDLVPFRSKWIRFHFDVCV